MKMFAKPTIKSVSLEKNINHEGIIKEEDV